MRKGIFLGIVLATGIFLVAAQYAYFSYHLTPSLHERAQKERFSALVGLPDSALVSEAHYVRHRSLGATFAFFSDAPSLAEYFPSTFVYHYSPSVTQTPSRIERAQ